MMVVRCSLDRCEENAGGYAIEVPNPDRGWCSECNQRIGDITVTHYFCSPDHALYWLQKYILSSEEMK